MATSSNAPQTPTTLGSNSGTPNTTIADNAPSVGFVYMQLPGYASPDVIWPGTVWNDISSAFAGCFLRAVGGDAAAFTHKQNEGIPNITGELGFSRTGIYDWNGALYNARDYNHDGSKSGSNTSNVGAIDASRSSPVYGASDHVTPVNYAVRFWCRRY